MNCHIKVCMKVHIRVRMHGTSHWCLHGSLHKVHMKVSRGIEVYMKDHWSFAKCAFISAQNLKIYIKVCSELHSRDCPKHCIQSSCLHILYGLEITLHQNLHKSSHWKLKLVGYIVVRRSHQVLLFWHK